MIMQIVGAGGEQISQHGPEVADAVSHGSEGVKEVLAHHILDSNTLQIPFLGEVRLPHLELFGLDISITKHVVMMWIASLLLVLIFGIAFRRKSLTPKGFASILEMIVQYVRDEIAIKNIGEEGKKYTSYLLTTFFFILTCNLIGLVPYGATATGNIGVTAALAGLAFIIIQLAGIVKYGLIGHFKNLIPPGIHPLLLPIIIPVEIMGMFTKPFALCIRLFANMIAGHIGILSLISLVFVLESILVAPGSILFALFFDVLEILIGFIQAYIFTVLTSLFIAMSVHPVH